MVFGFGRKKKSLEGKDGLTAGSADSSGVEKHNNLLKGVDEGFGRPFGGGITEPPIPHENLPSHPSSPGSLERLQQQPLQEKPQNLPSQPGSQDERLILAKLDTIKAQLDFLQQKFERIEQYLKKEDNTIRWR